MWCYCCHCNVSLPTGKPVISVIGPFRPASAPVHAEYVDHNHIRTYSLYIVLRSSTTTYGVDVDRSPINRHNQALFPILQQFYIWPLGVPSVNCQDGSPNGTTYLICVTA